jgi:lipopolysaccharide transport system ATP-binding protein
MSSSVIKVENLSKQYRIGERESYKTFREAIVRAFRTPYHRMRGALGRNQNDSPLLSAPRSKPSHDSNATPSALSLEQSPDPDTIWALKDVSFQVKQGEVVGIIGRNGAGKSTLLKILSKITDPTDGRVELKGRVGSLLEVGTGFHSELTGHENIYLYGAILGMDRWEVTRKFDEIVSFAALEKFIDTPVKRYSSGMYMRLAFAVAAHLETEILLVDEVLAVGDIAFQKKCLGKMGEISREGRTVLFVSHNMGAVQALCDKCVLLKEGKLQKYEATHEVIESYLNIHNKKQAIVSINSTMRNRGNGHVLFQSCAIYDHNNRGKNSFLIGEDFTIEISMDIRNLNKLYFWLIIMNSEGGPILSSHQGDIEMLTVKPGKYRLRCNTQGIGLMPGEYTISAGAFDAGRTFLEWIDNCQSFEILPTFVGGKAYDRRWGKVNQDIEWSLLVDEE